MEIGVTTLEADLSVTRDDVVVLSHDPLLNPANIRTPDGKWLKDHNIAIRSLSLSALKSYDAGRIDPASPYAKKLPGQAPVDGTTVPTLKELFELEASNGSPASEVHEHDGSVSRSTAPRLIHN